MSTTDDSSSFRNHKGNDCANEKLRSYRNLYEMIRRKPPVRPMESVWYLDFPVVNVTGVVVFKI